MILCAEFAQDSTGLISDGASKDARSRSELNLAVNSKRRAALEPLNATDMADLMMRVRIKRPLYLRMRSLKRSVHARRQLCQSISRFGESSVLVMRQTHQRRFEPRAFRRCQSSASL